MWNHRLVWIVKQHKNRESNNFMVKQQMVLWAFYCEFYVCQMVLMYEKSESLQIDCNDFVTIDKANWHYVNSSV